MFRTGLLLMNIFVAFTATAQPARYGTANIHAHNDYDHNVPFTQAYGLQLGSIEADVHLIRDTLFVAHSSRELKRNVLFGSSYLQPLANGIRALGGRVYADSLQQLQLLVDIKTDSLQTLDAVIRAVNQFPGLAGTPTLHIVITGRQPEPRYFDNYPSWISFDGRIDDPRYTNNTGRIALFSADFSKYSKWDGNGPIPEADLPGIRKAIRLAHSLHRPFRFWGVPDNPFVWQAMMDLGVDYINTDQIARAAAFLVPAKP